jgi:isopentenyl diphosphate isomerase/L-lactate dehydrogenase-like FMN-dependent dehydrogenase
MRALRRMRCTRNHISNHGGRYLDTIGEVASAALSGSAEVDVDGGIRRGTDMFKAWRLGTRARDDRPAGALGSLTVQRSDGVRDVLEHMRIELVRAMQLTGTVIHTASLAALTGLP